MYRLKRIPDREIFPELPSSDGSAAKNFSQAPLLALANVRVFIQRPNLSQYNMFSRHNVVHLLAQGLLEEAYTMEIICKHPHPNIGRYHGGCSRQSHLIGIVLDYRSYDLKGYIKDEPGVIDKEAFMDALESVIYYICLLGWPYNDLNQTNVSVNDLESGGGMPVLIDFGSAREIGRLWVLLLIACCSSNEKRDLDPCCHTRYDSVACRG